MFICYMIFIKRHLLTTKMFTFAVIWVGTYKSNEVTIFEVINRVESSYDTS